MQMQLVLYSASNHITNLKQEAKLSLGQPTVLPKSCRGHLT